MPMLSGRLSRLILNTSVSVELAGPPLVRMSTWAKAWRPKITSTTSRNIRTGEMSGSVMRSSRRTGAVAVERGRLHDLVGHRSAARPAR